jgi:hypothetical protein
MLLVPSFAYIYLHSFSITCTLVTALVGISPWNVNMILSVSYINIYYIHILKFVTSRHIQRFVLKAVQSWSAQAYLNYPNGSCQIIKICICILRTEFSVNFFHNNEILIRYLELITCQVCSQIFQIVMVVGVQSPFYLQYENIRFLQNSGNSLPNHMALTLKTIIFKASYSCLYTFPDLGNLWTF